MDFLKKIYKLAGIREIKSKYIYRVYVIDLNGTRGKICENGRQRQIIKGH